MSSTKSSPMEILNPPIRAIYSSASGIIVATFDATYFPPSLYRLVRATFVAALSCLLPIKDIDVSFPSPTSNDACDCCLASLLGLRGYDRMIDVDFTSPPTSGKCFGLSRGVIHMRSTNSCPRDILGPRICAIITSNNDIIVATVDATSFLICAVSLTKSSLNH